MKKIQGSSYLSTFLILSINLFLIEIIFRIISNSSLISFAILRILIFISILSSILSFIINLFKKSIIKKILICTIIFIGAIYSCAQLGFLSFLGVYASLQTSSQLGAVVDYIKDFIKSFKWYYFITFIPFITTLTYYILNKDNLNKDNIKRVSITTLVTVITLSILLYGTITIPFMQNSIQVVSNKDLFKTASNPSLTVENYGALGFGLLDIKAIIFPQKIENYIVSDKNIQKLNDNSRIIDDTAWLKLIEEEEIKEYNDLNNYFINRNITDKNEYTGLFKNKNLIVIMMESVNDIFLEYPEYYPNFNKVVSEGWNFENHYSPRNSCSTLNNEFSGMVGLYSIYNTCTASTYKDNTYFESIFNLFNRTDDYITFSAHNYTEAYYPRRIVHPNIGSSEYYGVEDLDITYHNEYKNWSNDDDFLEKVLEIIDEKTTNGENFMTWLTTVSSHQPYGVDSIQGNKYYDLTEDTNFPTDVRRYMSKLKILDNGIGILLDGLEKRGILEDTVIVFYGDHYPYGIPTSNLNKVMSYDTEEDKNMEQVPFVIYSKGIEPKVYEEYSTFINIVPTLANLFDLDYDPRLYLGDDLLSNDYNSITVFVDGSWKNEIAYYDASKNKITYYTDIEYTSDEIKKINEDVQTKIDVSALAIKTNYFEYLDNGLKSEFSRVKEIKEFMCSFDGKDIINNSSES